MLIHVFDPKPLRDTDHLENSIWHAEQLWLTEDELNTLEKNRNEITNKDTEKALHNRIQELERENVKLSSAIDYAMKCDVRVKDYMDRMKKNQEGFIIREPRPFPLKFNPVGEAIDFIKQNSSLLP